MSPRPKSCGPCTMCCKLLTVAELEKPAGTACRHLAKGGGCGIYETRPTACRTFECVWLMDPEMPHRFRPDQTKVMLDQDPEANWLVARCDPANPTAWRRNPMYMALKAFAAQHWGKGKLAMAVAGRRTWVITPKEDIDLGDVEPGSGFKVVEGADGTVTVEVAAPPT